MNIYSGRSTWKLLLGIFGVLVLIVTLIYSNYLAEKLKQNEERNIQIFRMAVEELFVDVADYKSRVFSLRSKTNSGRGRFQVFIQF